MKHDTESRTAYDMNSSATTPRNSNQNATTPRNSDQNETYMYIDIISIVILPSDRPKIDPSKCQPGPKQVSARRMFKIILARHIQETVEDHQLRNT